MADTTPKSDDSDADDAVVCVGTNKQSSAAASNKKTGDADNKVDDDDSLDAWANEPSPLVCICGGKGWKGGNKMCRKCPQELKERAKGLPLPDDWNSDDSPKTPPPLSNKIASTASKVSAINLAAQFNNEEEEEEEPSKRKKPKTTDAKTKTDAPALAPNEVDALLMEARKLVSPFERVDRFGLIYYYSMYPFIPEHPNDSLASVIYKTKPSSATTKISSAKPTAYKKKKTSAKTSKKKSLPRITPTTAAAIITKVAASASTKNDEIIDVDEDVDEDVEHLVKPPLTKKAPCWEHFRMYSSTSKQYSKDVAVCYLCYVNSNKKDHVEIATRSGATSGLNKHLQRHHKKEWDVLAGTGTSTYKPLMKQASVAHIFRVKPKEKTRDQLKIDHIHASTNWVVATCQPLNAVEHDSFRDMFRPFHPDAPEITNITSDTVRKNIFHLGKLAERATLAEVGKYKVSWTTDHWTGKDGATYQTITCHYIDEEWNLQRCMIDFKVFEGSTTGEKIYDDCIDVLRKYFTSEENIKLSVTDTTGSMGVLGRHLRQNNLEHCYCTDHVLQRNALIAFEGK